MGQHWVKAKVVIRRMNPAGEWETHYPGQWLQVRNQELEQLLAAGHIEATMQQRRTAFAMTGRGVVITGGDVARGKEFLAQVNIDATAGDPAFPERHCLWWHTDAALRLDLLPWGFHRLKGGWQIAAPLWRYGTLARDIGTPEARERTQAVIHDLRVPVYDTHLIYIRKDAETEKLLALWMEERKTGDDDKLCFMRALYQVKPLMCALPITWLAGARR